MRMSTADIRVSTSMIHSTGSRMGRSKPACAMPSPTAIAYKTPTATVPAAARNPILLAVVNARSPMSALYAAFVQAAARNSFIADEMTAIDERSNSNTRHAATTMSGHPAPVSQTAAAAMKTDRLAAMSLREHSQTELMLTSSARCCQSRYRHAEFAASATRLKTPITSKMGTVGVVSFQAIWPMTAHAASRMSTPLNSATRALAAVPRETTNRLRPYVSASPRLSRLSASSALE